MRRIILCLAITFLFAVIGVNAQTVTCPVDMVCITKTAAIKALQDSDKVIALEAENAVLRQAVADHKDIETNLKIELGKMSGELTGSQQMNVRQTAIIDVLLKNVRPKKIGLINLF